MNAFINFLDSIKMNHNIEIVNMIQTAYTTIE